MRRESCEGSPSDRRRIGCASTLVLSTRQTPLFVYFARQVQDCGRGASRYTARSVQSENRRLIVRKDVNPLIDGRGSRRSFKGSTLSLICGSAISSIWLSPCLFVCGGAVGIPGYVGGGCRKSGEKLSCRCVRGVDHVHEEAEREERTLVPGTVVFVIKNIKFYVLCHTAQHRPGGERC